MAPRGATWKPSRVSGHARAGVRLITPRGSTAVALRQRRVYLRPRCLRAAPFGEALDQDAHDSECDPRSLAKHALELVTAQPDRPDGTIGDERRDPGCLRDERHLPDDVARAAPRKLALRSLSALNHANRALDHNVELLADFALGSDDLAIGVAALLDQLRDALEDCRRQIGEQGDLAEEQDALDHRERRDGTWHGTSFSPSTDHVRTLPDERILVLQRDGQPLAARARGRTHRFPKR